MGPRCRRLWPGGLRMRVRISLLSLRQLGDAGGGCSEPSLCASASSEQSASAAPPVIQSVAFPSLAAASPATSERLGPCAKQARLPSPPGCCDEATSGVYWPAFGDVTGRASPRAGPTGKAGRLHRWCAPRLPGALPYDRPANLLVGHGRRPARHRRARRASDRVRSDLADAGAQPSMARSKAATRS
jgi:hypothetical protein